MPRGYDFPKSGARTRAAPNGRGARGQPDLTRALVQTVWPRAPTAPSAGLGAPGARKKAPLAPKENAFGARGVARTVATLGLLGR